MSQKGRLPAEDKIRLVEMYLAGEIGVSEVERKYGINHKSLYRWVQRYQTRGASGLEETDQVRQYDPMLKKQAVEEYLSGVGSLDAICRKYDISDNAMLRKWIRKHTNHEEFRQPHSGGAIYMVTGRKTTWEERVDIVSYCLAENKDYGKTIERYEVSYQQIYGWVKKYEQHGVEGLVDRRGKRKDEASMNDIERLQAQIKLKEAENLRLRMENDLLKKLEELERGLGAD